MARATGHTVMVHHWSPAFTRLEVVSDCYPNTVEKADDDVVAYNAECSVPFTIVVRETGDISFSLAPEPERCPLCGRVFDVWDRKRIRNAAIAAHLRTAWSPDEGEEGEPSPANVLDVVLDA